MADFSDTMSGDFLPLQIIYQGKTTKSLPSDWDVTYTENHWSNEGTMIQCLERILFPYIEKK